MNKEHVHQSVFFNAPAIFPDIRFDPNNDPYQRISVCQEIFGVGYVYDGPDRNHVLNHTVPGIIICDSLSKREINIEEGKDEIINTIKLNRYIKKIRIGYHFTQSNYKNEHVWYHFLLLKIPIGINIVDLFNRYDLKNDDNDYTYTYGVERKIRTGYSNIYQVADANQRIAASKYIIVSKMIDIVKAVTSELVWEDCIEYNKEITLYSNEQIIALIVSYDTKLYTSGLTLPIEPYEPSESTSVMGHVGNFSADVSYDIYF